MGTVYNNPGAMPSSCLDDPGQGTQITLHGEHTVGKDEFAGGGVSCGEKPLQVIDVSVSVPAVRGRTKPDGIYQRCMVEPVTKHHIAPAEQSRHRQVRLETSGDHDSCFPAEERGQSSF
jgi:hypothetical protein